jgi:hypothetical protein
MLRRFAACRIQGWEEGAVDRWIGAGDTTGLGQNARTTGGAGIAQGFGTSQLGYLRSAPVLPAANLHFGITSSSPETKPRSGVLKVHAHGISGLLGKRSPPEGGLRFDWIADERLC